MGLNFAIDALYATGFTPADAMACIISPEGRAYPTIDAVMDALRAHNCELSIRHVPLFDCYLAQWRDVHSGAEGELLGGVAGQSAEEAAVYALALHRQHESEHALHP
jgi:hypothetical protein